MHSSDTSHPTDAGWLPGDVAAINSADIDSNAAVGEVIDALTADPSLADDLLGSVKVPVRARGESSVITYLDELPFFAPNDTVGNVSLSDQVEQLLLADGGAILAHKELNALEPGTTQVVYAADGVTPLYAATAPEFTGASPVEYAGSAVKLDDSLPIEADGEELPPLTAEQLATLETALALRGKSSGPKGVMDFFKALELTGTPLTAEQESLYTQLKKMQKVFPQVHGKHVHIKKRKSKTRAKR